MGNHIERTTDLARAVHVLRQQGVTVSFPMQTAEGEIIFAVGEDSTLTADQILELLGREELHAEGVRRLVEAQAENQRRLATLRRQAASALTGVQIKARMPSGSGDVSLAKNVASSRRKADDVLSFGIIPSDFPALS